MTMSLKFIFKEEHNALLETVGETVNIYIMKNRSYYGVHTCNLSTGEVEVEDWELGLHR
jgi:hypothetical protein